MISNMLSSFLKKLLFARQFFNMNGKLEILGERNVIMEPELFLMLNEASYGLGKESAKIFFEKYKKKIDLKQNNYSNLMNLLEILGLGSVKIMKVGEKSATISVKDSIISEQYRKKRGKSKSNTCEFIAGFLAGTFSFISNSETDAQETACASKGGSVCIFEVKW